MRPLDITKLCWCKTVTGGCSIPIVESEHATHKHLCPVCRTAGHSAYTPRQIERILVKRKEATNGHRRAV